MSSGLLFTKETVGPVANQSMLASSLASSLAKPTERGFATGSSIISFDAPSVVELPIGPGFAAGNAIRALLSVYAARNGGILPAVYGPNSTLLVPARPLPHVTLVDLNMYEIRIADERDGGIDADYPPVDHGACLMSIGVERFVLSDATSDTLLLGFGIRQVAPELPGDPAPLLLLVDRFPEQYQSASATASSSAPNISPFPVHLMAAPVAADAPYGSLTGASRTLHPLAALAPSYRVPLFHSATAHDSPSPGSGSRDRPERESTGSRSSPAGRLSGFMDD